MLSSLYIGISGYYLQSNLLYIILVVPALLIACAAQIAVKKTYAKMSSVYSKSGYSGAQAAEAVLRRSGINNVRIEQCSGQLSDHYDPRSNVIRLSEGVYTSTSVAAIGIACHEAGHAVQHANNYLPIKIRNSLIPVCNIGSMAGIPLAFLGYFLSFEPLILIGLGLYSFILLFQIATLPVELDASRRALKAIEENRMLADSGELAGTKKVLTAAAFTYIAAIVVSLANLIRFILLFGSRRSRR